MKKVRRNYKLLREWLKRLKSRKYKQGTGSLRTLIKGKVDRWCCLGVLGDCINSKMWQNVPNTHNCSYSYGTDNEYEVLPDEVFAKLGFPELNQTTLAEINDIYGWKFGKIAKYIENVCLKKKSTKGE